MIKVLSTLCLLHFPVSAIAEDRFLPTIERDALNVSFHQDGRAIYVSISNGSKLVLTSAEIVCVGNPQTPASPQVDREPAPAEPWCPPSDRSKASSPSTSTYCPGTPPPQWITQNKNNPTAMAALAKYNAYWQANRYGTPLTPLRTSATSQYSARLLPGKSDELYLEAKENDRVDNCTLSNARGREKHIYELF